MVTTKEMLDTVLKELERAGGITASAVVSRDGLLMSSSLMGGVGAETFAAMSATMYGAAETAVSELKKGVPERVVIESKDSKLIASGAGPKALLVVMTEANVGLGLVLVNMGKAADKIKELLR
jgi:hypothetical protein